MDNITDISNNKDMPVFPGWEPKKLKDKHNSSLEIEVVEETILGKLLKVTDEIICPVCDHYNELSQLTVKDVEEQNKALVYCYCCNSSYAVEIKNEN